MRRDLAELVNRPEGYHFSWVASDGRTYTAPLLTPPDYQAVQREDGSWYRVPRPIGPNNPPPYTQAWYTEYLRYHGLPSYFLRPAHLVMLNDDDLEADWLGVHNSPSLRAALNPPAEYLRYRYPADPLWPEPRSGVYRLTRLTEGPRANMARYHPALGVDGFPYNIFVWPSGQIELLLETDNRVDSPPDIDENDAGWNSFEEGGPVSSHYQQVAIGSHHVPFSRESLIQRAINNHDVINPMEDIPGLGRLSFLSEADEQHAHASGFATPFDVSLARRAGALAAGTGSNAGPVVIFRPDRAFLNPTSQPLGPGAWRFLTSAGDSSNASLAAVQFGGSHGLPTYPSARQIRLLGGLFREDRRADLTEEIDLVWVPGEEDDAVEVDPVLDGEAQREVEEEEEEEEETEVEPASISGSSPVAKRPRPGPPLDPTNGTPGGDHDQTGGKRADHFAVKKNGRTAIVDRSRVHVGSPEPHKFWCHGARGWRKWAHSATMDWENVKRVAALNKHREQTYNRAKLPPLRKKRRPDYTKLEREFVMGHIKDAKGERPTMSIPELTAEFNRRFEQRNVAGITSLIERLRAEFAKYGDLKQRNPRGWKQKEESKRLLNAGKKIPPKESEEEGEDDKVEEQ